MQYFIRPQVDFIEKSTPKRAFFWSTRRDSPLVIEQSTGLFSRISSAVGFKIRNLVSRPFLKAKKQAKACFFVFGPPEGTRTPNLLNRNQMH